MTAKPERAVSKMRYDPEKHHRRSIRLTGHDYAGGGTYFVTLCAHQECITAFKGDPFGSMRELIKERMRITSEKCPQMQWGETAIMPDHFHALIRIRKGGHLTLGDILGGLKAAVSREWRRSRKAGGEGEACLAFSRGDLASAEARNRFVLTHADKRWLPYIAPGGMLDRLLNEIPSPPATHKNLDHGAHHA